MYTRYIFFIICLFIFEQSFANSGHNLPQAKPTENTCESKDPDFNTDMACIEKQLTTAGLGGWVHASVTDQQMLVFTWRRPGNFFINVQLPMASKDPQIYEQLLKLRRHDQINIKGEFFKNEAPLKHINVTELTIVKAYDGPEEQYEYDPQLPTTILNETKLIGKIHIVANGGSVIVVEVGDRVIPVFNKKPELANGLFRNDKIELNYSVQFLPTRPAHLMVDTSLENPIRVLEEIAAGHGDIITLKGPLVMFPESPQIVFNVFALRTEDNDGVARNHTILNFSDIELFKSIREKLQQAWDDAIETAEYDRNKYINRKVIVTVYGEKNVVSANQANPQIIPNNIKDVKVEFN